MELDIEALNRTRKAAALARTFLNAGVRADHVEYIDTPRGRALALAATQDGRWTAASEQTWAEVKTIVRAFG